MIFNRRRHRVPPLNATSTADISFMLLIFFLVTSNMDVDKGLMRRLPPAEAKVQQETFVAKGTMMTLRLTADNKLLADGDTIVPGQLRRRTADFVRQVGKKHLIKIDASPQTRYDLYFQVQNELAAAYQELREEAARRIYRRNYTSLTDEERKKVNSECPRRIAEQYNGAQSEEAGAEKKGGEL